ncbi:sensor histidine kinase [Leucobacter albus]|uniref:Sensor histidine kinase n=1 Tax=Leucobacter albus TaxID=272210 RepID=A0ABW3TT94_9MICO
MKSMRAWDVALAFTLTGVGVLAAFTSAPAPKPLVAYAALAAIGVAYLVAGRQLLRVADTAESRPTAALWFLAVISVLAAIGAANVPSLATLQIILYPMLWNLSPSYRRSIALSAVMAVVLGVGLWVGNAQFSDDTPVLAVVTQSFSFAFSVALGSWFTTIARQGEEATELLAELRASQSEVAELSAQAGAAAERARLSRELHDTLTQSLSGLVMLAERASQEAAGRAGDNPGAAPPEQQKPTPTPTLSLLERAARQALDEARALVSQTHPIGDRGLTESIRRISAAAAAETGLKITVEAAELQLPRDTQVVLLRCAQEGLANVRKHARATSARVTLADDGASAVLTVVDDGVGPVAPRPAGSPRQGGAASGSGSASAAASASGSGSASAEGSASVADPSRAAATAPPRPSAARGGFGLAGIRERVTIAGGRVDFGAAPGGGSRLRVSLPHHAAPPLPGRPTL